LAPTLQTLVKLTQEPFVQAIQDLSVRRLVFGRSLLRGDAAYVPRPHTAGSTAKAAANAVALAVAPSRSGGDIEQALSRWEAQQRQLGIGMPALGISSGNRIMRVGR
jgi:2-polyprenyl-6-methoxyphenol hydroxylase-like FAD-dependent oxidoreductase